MILTTNAIMNIKYNDPSRPCLSGQTKNDGTYNPYDKIGYPMDM